MDIPILIVSIICLVFSFFCMVLLFKIKNNNNKVNPTESYFSKENIDNLNKSLIIIENNIAKINEYFPSLSLTLSDRINASFTTQNKDLVDFKEKVLSSLNEHTNFTIKAINEFKSTIGESLNKSLLAMQTQFNTNMEKINSKVEERLSQGFEKTNATFKQIIESLQKVNEVNTNMVNLTQEVTSLQNILNNNKARGSFGELQLNQILESIFGVDSPLFATQYPLNLKDGSKGIVDAVVFMNMPEKDTPTLICIDSKFPLDDYLVYSDSNDEEERKKALRNLNTSVKKRIDEVKKYIIEDVTYYHAIMFIPNDGIFALVQSKIPSLIEYAQKCNVFVTCPSTILPILHSINAYRLSQSSAKNAKIIQSCLLKLNKNFISFADEWKKMKSNIASLSKHSDKIDKRVGQISSNFTLIEGNKFELVEEEEEEEDITLPVS